MTSFLGRATQDAVRSYLSNRQEALSCVARSPVVPSSASAGILDVRASTGSLRGTTGAIFASFQEQVALGILDQQRAATTRAYRYKLESGDGQEVLSYHWHPAGRSHVTEPHLHLGSLGGTFERLLAGRHLPTGEVSFQQFVRFLITEVGVRPLRDDWERVLAEG